MTLSRRQQRALERFKTFYRRPDVQAHAERYADWARQDGALLMMMMSLLSMLCLSGKMPPEEYYRAVRAAERTSGLRSADYRLMVECAFEQCRVMLVGSGQLVRPVFDDLSRRAWQ